jgi:transposase
MFIAAVLYPARNGIPWQDLPECPGPWPLSGRIFHQAACRLYERKHRRVLDCKTNRTNEIIYDKEQYKLRQKVARLFNKLKRFQRIATRYDKRTRTFLAFIHTAATWLIIR